MKYLLIGLIGMTTYLLIQNQFDDRYKTGYLAGKKEALKTNPPSEDLELVCVGLWIGEQNKKYWERENASNTK